MEIRTIRPIQNDEIKGKIIRKNYIAKELLHCDPPHTIIDIKPDRLDPDHKRTVFVFADNERFQNDLDRIMKEIKKQRENEEIEARVQAEVEARIQAEVEKRIHELHTKE